MQDQQKPPFVLDNTMDPLAPRTCSCGTTMYLLDHVCFDGVCQKCSRNVTHGYDDHLRRVAMRDAYIRGLARKRSILTNA